MAVDRASLPAADDFRLCVLTLHDEAELLDGRRYGEWLKIVAEDVDYRIISPVQPPGAESGPVYDPSRYYLRCTRVDLERRVERVHSGWAASEDPPAATRRFLSNIRLLRVGDELHTKSNMLMFRARWDKSELVSAEREDVWREVDGKLSLRKRWIYLDQTSLPVENLGAFL